MRQVRGRTICAEHPKVIHEYLYLLGLYFADGTLRKNGKSIAIALQTDEGEIAERIANTLRCMKLVPRIRVPRSGNMIFVEANACNMDSFFPRKAVTLNGEAEALRRFLTEKSLLTCENKSVIAFLAGLMDGDGTCYVTLRVDKRYSFPKGNVAFQWLFTAVSYPILASYFDFAVRHLLGGSAALSVYKHKGCMCVVRIHRSGIIQLLNHGFADYCFKAKRWGESYSQLRAIQRANSFYSLRAVSRLLGVTVGLCRKMLQLGLLGGKKQIYQSPSGDKSRYLFSKEEFECLHERKDEILQKYYDNHRSLREVCRKLHLCPDTGMKLFDAGAIKGERKVYPSGQVRYSIPRDEVDSLLTKVKGRVKVVY